MQEPVIRLLASRIHEYLRMFPAVVLIGPRQVGKTTLARALSAAYEGAYGPAAYLDLERPADLDMLDDAGAYLEGLSGRQTILDEVQRMPGLFEVLRGVIDQRIREGEATGQFLLLGSASMDLLQQAGESLAGRIGILELGPLDIREVGPVEES